MVETRSQSITGPIKRGTCRCGCGRVLKDVGQCRYCSRSLECCNNADAVGSCAHKYANLTAAGKRRSDRAREAYYVSHTSGRQQR